MAKIAFIGLGHMGGGMAPNLAKAGHEVRAFDLVPEAVQHAAEAGCSPLARLPKRSKAPTSSSPCSPPHSTSARSMRKTSRPTPSRALLIDCSTIDVASARDVGEAMKAKGFDFVDAPVSGGIAAAAAGTLTLMVGGTDEAVRARQAVPRADGQGGDPRRATRRGPGGQDLQQHDPRRDHGRDVRGVRAGARSSVSIRRSSSTSRPRPRARAGR